MRTRIFVTLVAFGALSAGPVLAQSVVVVPDEVDQYVEEQPYDDSVAMDGDIAVGQELPDTVVIRQVPKHDDYSYAVVNRHRVIVEPATRRIIRVYQ